MSAIRVQVLPGGEIEIMHAHRRKERNTFHRTMHPETARMWFAYWLGVELDAEKKTRFVTQQQKDGRKAYREIERGSPHNGKK